MQQPNHSAKPGFWPTPQDYNEAVQDLLGNLGDPVLRMGKVETGRFGLPKPITGGFASVYKVRADGRDWALRCFLRHVPGVEERYRQISSFLTNAQLPHTTEIEYQPQGIRVHGHWFPLLKMEWVSGPTLDEYLRTLFQSGSSLDLKLCEEFKEMCRRLQNAGLSHGDLQHGNILLGSDGFKLVDYDGMYVPSMDGQFSSELGHRNYQHPQRAATDFGVTLDNFSAWVIYISLRALALDERLGQSSHFGDDCLLFRASDFSEPLRSPAFAALEYHENQELRHLSRFLRWLLLLPPHQIPPLDQERAIPMRLLPVRAQSGEASPAVARDESLPDNCLAPDNVVQLTTVKHASAGRLHRLSGSRRQLINPEPLKIDGKMPAALPFGPLSASSPIPSPVTPRIISLRNRLNEERVQAFMLPMYSVLALCVILSVANFFAGQVLVHLCMTAVLPVLVVSILRAQWCLGRLPLPQPDEELLFKYGKATTGKIVGTFQRYGTYHIEYLFQFREQVVKHSVPVGQADYQRAQEMIGQTISVLFDERIGDSIIYEFCTLRPVGKWSWLSRS